VLGEAHALGQDDAKAIKKRSLGRIWLGHTAQTNLAVHRGRQDDVLGLNAGKFFQDCAWGIAETCALLPHLKALPQHERQEADEDIPFVVGDGGGSLDEGSARLLLTISGADKLPTKTTTTALGMPVERLLGAKDGDFRVVIFRHTAPLMSSDEGKKSHVLDKTAAELPNWIRDTVAAKLQSIGGAQVMKDCTTP
jgi:hypothetical protein